ncbi:CapA family protein [Dactylosporangium sp. NPDC048998]|uniref:CapA family protein n=1 Tax=Dactylosporangium sp. NPDC048998 TaxID=3363976 RepID=UPI0037165A93
MWWSCSTVWGTERDSCPNADQKQFAAPLADAGADMVISAHAHVLQGDGWLGRTYLTGTCPRLPTGFCPLSGGWTAAVGRPGYTAPQPLRLHKILCLPIRRRTKATVSALIAG